MSMNFGGKTWSIDPQDFNLGAVDTTGKTCQGAIFVLSQGADVGSSGTSPDWVVGDTFLVCNLPATELLF
jgi:cathepsin D